MTLDRRNFLHLSACGGLAASFGCNRPPAESRDTQPRGPSIEELDRAAAQPILKLDGLSDPIIIDSIRLLEKDGEQFVHVRSKDGAEGLSLTNRRSYFAPILKELIIPFFLGKDARTLESELLFGLYRYRSSYKLQGLAFWSAQAWVEFAILDMLGRVAGKSMGELLGGVIRREVPYYIASGRRDSTPEEEVEYLQELLDETKARAVKFRVGGWSELE